MTDHIPQIEADQEHPSRIRVVVADDHPIVRSGVRDELAHQPDMEVVGEAANGDEALHLVQTLQPDVLVLDINMPGLRAVQVARQLGALPAPPAVLVLSAYGDPEYVVAMLKAGATGYLLKDEPPTRIVKGVRAVAQGQTWLSTAVVATLVKYQAMGEESLEELDLSPREREVLRLLARGYRNRQIAEALGISEKTVKNHLTGLYGRLKVHSRTEAVAWAWQQGLVKPE